MKKITLLFLLFIPIFSYSEQCPYVLSDKIFIDNPVLKRVVDDIYLKMGKGKGSGEFKPFNLRLSASQIITIPKNDLNLWNVQDNLDELESEKLTNQGYNREENRTFYDGQWYGNNMSLIFRSTTTTGDPRYTLEITSGSFQVDSSTTADKIFRVNENGLYLKSYTGSFSVYGDGNFYSIYNRTGYDNHFYNNDNGLNLYNGVVASDYSPKFIFSNANGNCGVIRGYRNAVSGSQRLLFSGMSSIEPEGTVALGTGLVPFAWGNFISLIGGFVGNTSSAIITNLYVTGYSTMSSDTDFLSLIRGTSEYLSGTLYVNNISSINTLNVATITVSGYGIVKNTFTVEKMSYFSSSTYSGNQIFNDFEENRKLTIDFNQITGQNIGFGYDGQIRFNDGESGVWISSYCQINGDGGGNTLKLYDTTPQLQLYDTGGTTTTIWSNVLGLKILPASGFTYHYGTMDMWGYNLQNVSTITVGGATGYPQIYSKASNWLVLGSSVQVNGNLTVNGNIAPNNITMNNAIEISIANLTARMLVDDVGEVLIDDSGAVLIYNPDDR